MSLKPQPDKTAPAKPAPITWGVLAQPDESVGAIRFECSDAAYSYPYHTLSRWVLKEGRPERLEITAGGDVIIVTGFQLWTIRGALDEGRLKVLFPPRTRYDGLTSPAETTINSVTVRLRETDAESC